MSDLEHNYYTSMVGDGNRLINFTWSKILIILALLIMHCSKKKLMFGATQQH